MSHRDSNLGATLALQDKQTSKKVTPMITTLVNDAKQAVRGGTYHSTPACKHSQLLTVSGRLPQLSAPGGGLSDHCFHGLTRLQPIGWTGVCARIDRLIHPITLCVQHRIRADERDSRHSRHRSILRLKQCSRRLSTLTKGLNYNLLYCAQCCLGGTRPFPVALK